MPLALGEVGHLLGDQQVEPARALGPGDDDGAAVRPVDDDGAARGRALLGEGIAVVGGDVGVRAGVGPVGVADRPGRVQQR